MASTYKILQQALANPIKLVPVNYGQPVRYQTPNFDLTLFCKQFKGWENSSTYSQKWRHEDQTALQFHTNTNYATVANSTPTLKLLDVNGKVIISYDAPIQETWAGNIYTRDGLSFPMYTYTFNVYFSNIPDGTYFFQLSAGFDTTGDATVDSTELYVSEPQLVSSNIIETVLLEYYSQGILAFNTFFENYVFRMRVEGAVEYFAPDSDDTQYNDEYFNIRMLNSYTFRKFNLFVGGVAGIPAYVIDKINIALGCKHFKIDSANYTKGDGVKIEIAKGDKRYWGALEIREAENYHDQTSVIMSGLILMTLPATRSALRSITMGTIPYYMAVIIDPTNYGAFLYYLNTTFVTTAHLTGYFSQQGNNVVYILGPNEAIASISSVILSKVVSMDKSYFSNLSIQFIGNYAVVDWGEAGATSGMGTGTSTNQALSYNYTSAATTTVQIYHNDALTNIQFNDATIYSIYGTLPATLSTLNILGSAIRTFDWNLLQPCTTTIQGVSVVGSLVSSVPNWATLVLPAIVNIAFNNNKLSSDTADGMVMAQNQLVSRNSSMQGGSRSLHVNGQMPPAPLHQSGLDAKFALSLKGWSVTND